MSQNVGPKMIAAGVGNKLILARSLRCDQVMDLIKQEEDNDSSYATINLEDEEQHNGFTRTAKFSNG